MFYRFCRSLRRFFHRSRTLNNEPLNKVSLVVVILIDIFILTNVFIGLNDVGQWYMSPAEAYPCYAEWDSYRVQTAEDKDFNLVRWAADQNNVGLKPQYERAAIDRLGEVSDLCLQYADAKDAIKQSDNTNRLEQLSEKEDAIATLENTNRTIRQQYDSTLLEEIAEQPREQSINLTSADQAKATLTENEAQITALKAEITTLKDELLSNPESAAFLTLLNQNAAFQTVEQGYDRASFWYPSIQLAFQAVFLVPLILVAFGVYTIAQRKRYGLIALISWHLLVIFFIPLILKAFEFMQMGVLFTAVFNIVTVLFGRLLFLVSYIYILLIPLLGFGVIKFAQRFIFNPKLQAAGRIQKSRCIKCAKKLQAHDSHCPHCGYHQHQECNHCHQPTYKYLPYCYHCGQPMATR
ncbi:hypothetical protein N836_22045 [Leptolyngbya sp. Heron Island J]|uniref:hypothetical protein n=1 Tax=Leptolyngbya sp. Heron Island J TaxID=1385935 RepID=UPI0003B987F9|nr:hypothetical protein [Leptolyngbya sp. Heron Island J]ESA33372.1 hypothetical protein N836_22045 [Leptolyngbya sp. Heron Island J]